MSGHLKWEDTNPSKRIIYRRGGGEKTFLVNAFGMLKNL